MVINNSYKQSYKEQGHSKVPSGSWCLCNSLGLDVQFLFLIGVGGLQNIFWIRISICVHNASSSMLLQVTFIIISYIPTLINQRLKEGNYRFINHLILARCNQPSYISKMQHKNPWAMHSLGEYNIFIQNMNSKADEKKQLWECIAWYQIISQGESMNQQLIIIYGTSRGIYNERISYPPQGNIKSQWRTGSSNWKS